MVSEHSFGKADKDMVETVELSQIAFDAGTQVREAIDETVVTDYAAAMLAGSDFPPIVVFHDSTRYYLADGFHRALAARRNDKPSLEADVRQGTLQDALWFALGANKVNGKRLTQSDKTHAIQLARTMWPEKMQREIAAQVGCHQSLVSIVTANMTGHKSGTTGRQRQVKERHAEVERLLAEGLSTKEIVEKVGLSRSRVSGVRVALGQSKKLDTSRAGIHKRRNQIRSMALKGYTSIQIAAKVGMSVDGCRNWLREEGIEVPADRSTRGSHSLNSMRIVEHIVMDAEGLTADMNLIEFSTLDKAKLPGWIESLNVSWAQLGTLIKRLRKEQAA